jgi:hypothetical protein
MLRTKGYIVTSLCANNLETERSPKTWEAHKSRLHVNAGCGAIAVEDDPPIINSEFVPVNWRKVPPHIRKDFHNAIN